MNYSFKARVRVLAGFSILVALLFIGQLFLVQVVSGDEYKQRADRQFRSNQAHGFDRGSIFFQDRQNHLFSAATIQRGFEVYIQPQKIENEQEAYNKLNQALDTFNIDKDTFIYRANRDDSLYQPLLRQVDQETSQLVSDLGVNGIEVRSNSWRAYPNNSMGAHILGFVGSDGINYSGRYGLEKYYDDVLYRDNSELFVNFFAEAFSNINQAISRSDQREGDLVTTIDPIVQMELENISEQISTEYESQQTGAMIIEPDSGRIKAMSLHPTFDPNNFNLENDVSIFSNSLVEHVFELGSVVKVLTVAAGIDSGAIEPDTAYYDEGSISVDGHEISNFDGRSRGNIDVQQSLSESLNTGMAFSLEEMGKETFLQYLLDFSLDEETGIDLPNEARSDLGNLKESPRDVEYVTASFGQGIALTPISAVRAFSTVANGGEKIYPHLVEKIEETSGRTRDFSPREGERVLQEETSEKVSRMLVGAVDDYLLGGRLSLDNYSVAGKSGTAQVSKEFDSGYEEDKFLHSYFGYFPAYDPKYLIFLYTLEPNGVQYASESLGEPFMETVEFLINHYNVRPDR